MQLRMSMAPGTGVKLQQKHLTAMQVNEKVLNTTVFKIVLVAIPGEIFPITAAIHPVFFGSPWLKVCLPGNR
jgi:hypothetical protein